MRPITLGNDYTENTLENINVFLCNMLRLVSAASDRKHVKVNSFFCYILHTPSEPLHYDYGVV